ALPSGSCLTISHPSADFSPEEATGAVAASERSGISFTPRTQAEVAAFFAGLELVDPGVVPVLAWRPGGDAPADPSAVYYYGAVGRNPGDTPASATAAAAPPPGGEWPRRLLEVAIIGNRRIAWAMVSAAQSCHRAGGQPRTTVSSRY